LTLIVTRATRFGRGSCFRKAVKGLRAVTDESLVPSRLVVDEQDR